MALDRNYTSASITAVDLCGQQSEPSKFELPVIITGDNGNSLPCNSAVNSLALALVLIVIVCSTITIIAIIIVAYRRQRNRKANFDLPVNEL